jgi:phosphoribosyl 1,2-cyclic phosphate phosphodiesterase
LRDENFARFLDSQLSTFNPQLSLTFLGTWYFAGCADDSLRLRVCRSPDPRDNRTRASIYLQTPEGSYVVDTGTDFRTSVCAKIFGKSTPSS